MDASLNREALANNFNLLRLMLAVMVALGHFKTLPGLSAPFGIHAYADFAVDAFFVVSGFLVCGSFDAKPNWLGFYLRRVFRVYPLYLIVILLQALLMLLCFAQPLAHTGGALRYILPNLAFATFLGYDIDGLLKPLHNPGINPSLWTLKIEMGFYLILPLLWTCTRRYGMWLLGLVYVASVAFAGWAHLHGMEGMAKQLPGQMSFFATGMLLYRFQHRIHLPPVAALFLAVALFAVCSLRAEMGVMRAIYPLLVGLFVFCFALRLPAAPLRFDISYGVYLFHGPLIQFSLLLGWFSDSYGFLLLLLMTACALAFLSDELIERPGIALGKRLARRVEGKA